MLIQVPQRASLEVNHNLLLLHPTLKRPYSLENTGALTPPGHGALEEVMQGALGGERIL